MILRVVPEDGRNTSRWSWEAENVLIRKSYHIEKEQSQMFSYKVEKEISFPGGK